MRALALIAVWGMMLATLAIATPAHAGSTFYFNENLSYRSAANSPFSGTSGLRLENFEDGKLNSGGVRVDHGFVRSSGTATDSVDADDGSINGFGRAGRSFSSGSYKSMTFTFRQSSTGKLPSMAGLVWTDGRRDSTITFRAWDAYGAFLGKIVVRLGDLARHGQTAEDRFLGVKSTTGISKISIVSNYAGFEVDHLQYMYGFAVVPVPPALALGAVGLAGVMATRRFWTHSRNRGKQRSVG